MKREQERKTVRIAKETLRKSEKYQPIAEALDQLILYVNFVVQKEIHANYSKALLRSGR